jgi:hypothetical protein
MAVGEDRKARKGKALLACERTNSPPRGGGHHGWNRAPRLTGERTIDIIHELTREGRRKGVRGTPFTERLPSTVYAGGAVKAILCHDFRRRGEHREKIEDTHIPENT